MRGDAPAAETRGGADESRGRADDEHARRAGQPSRSRPAGRRRRAAGREARGLAGEFFVSRCNRRRSRRGDRTLRRRPSATVSGRDGRESRRVDRRRHDSDSRRRRARVVAFAARRTRRSSRGALRQDSSVRRRHSRARDRALQRVGDDARRDARRGGQDAARAHRHDGLLRHPFSGAVSSLERARDRHRRRAGCVHGADGRGALVAAAASARDRVARVRRRRGSVGRARRRPQDVRTFADSRSVGRVARAFARGSWCCLRRSRYHPASRTYVSASPRSNTVASSRRPIHGDPVAVRRGCRRFIRASARATARGRRPRARGARSGAVDRDGAQARLCRPVSAAHALRDLDRRGRDRQGRGVQRRSGHRRARDLGRAHRVRLFRPAR